MPLANELSKRATRLLQLKQELDYHEKAAYLLKREIAGIEHEQIPHIMLEEGIKTCTTVQEDTGESMKVTIHEQLFVKIEDKEAFHKLLEDRGDSHIIKTAVELEKLPDALRKKVIKLLCIDLDVSAKVHNTVHHATAQKYVKDLISSDPEIEELVSSFAKLTPRWATKITHK